MAIAAKAAMNDRADNKKLKVLGAPQTNLKLVSDDEPGYTREKWGKGFTYLDPEGKRVGDPRQLARLKALVIPPAWRDVWICTDPKGYLQVTGRDEKDRKQYLYHPDWTAYQQADKFAKMEDFARQLPMIRAACRRDLRKKGWPQKKVLALIVEVLDECALRIGNEQYKTENETFGITTLRRKHVEISKGLLTFSYKGKSNIYQEISLEDKKLIRLIRQCSELSGHEVFRYLDDNGKSHSVDSSEVNEYIREIAGPEFSSKDFRTWAATSKAVRYYEKAKTEVEENPRKKLLPTLIARVAKELGNTVSVCRKYYIHPKVLAAVEENKIPSIDSITKKEDNAFAGELDPEELIAYRLIREA